MAAVLPTATQFPYEAVFAAGTGGMLEAPEARAITLSVDGERFDMEAAAVSYYRRSLDPRSGVIERSLEWRTSAGKQVAIRIRRLACLAHEHLFAAEYEVTPLNFSGPLWLLSTVDGAAGPELDLVGFEQEGRLSMITQRSHDGGYTRVTAIDSEIAGAGCATYEDEDGQTAGQAFTVHARLDEPVRLTRFGACFTSRQDAASQLQARARQALAEARNAGFDALCAQQRVCLAGPAGRALLPNRQ